MTPISPDDVLKEVSIDFKRKRLTHAMAAEKAGFGCKQSISNILSSHKYMSRYHAEKFSEAFGYNPKFLMTGIGNLFRDEQDTMPEECSHMTLNTLGVPYTITDGTTAGDMNVLLNWIRRIFSKQNNKEGLDIYPELYRFVQSRAIAKASMATYQGDNPADLEYVSRLTKLQSEIVMNVETMIDNIKMDS